MLLEPTRESKPLHSAVIVLNTDMTLRAILLDDIDQTGGYEEGQTGRSAPVIIDAVGGVVGVSLEIE